MKSSFIAALVLCVAGDVCAAPPKLTGAWASARTADDESVSVVLKDMGKAEIVNEYDISLPGRAKQRGRSTSFGKWTLKGNDVLVTYSKITDRLRYSDHESLSAIGQTGDAAALKPVGKPDKNSKIGAAILWKAPHEYRLKAPAASPQAPEPAGSPTTNQ
jgi:hypothetical protein